MDTQSPIMSLTAFFRDARAKGQTRQATQESADLLARFFDRYSFEACSADQLLALADLALRARNLGVAREALNRALATADRVHLAYYKLGRLELTADDPAAAAEQFAWGTDVDPGFAYNWMGRARALAAQGQLAEAAAHAERFVAFGVRPHSPEDVVVLAELADHLFESGERLRASPIYAALRGWAPPAQKTLVRLSESLISAGDHAAALDVLRPAHEAGQLDLWGRRALAQCESHAGNHAAALALADGIIAERPEDSGFVSTWLDVMVRAQRARPATPPLWRDALARHHTRLPQAGRTELQVRAALAEGDVQGALAEMAGAKLTTGTRLFFMGLETAYAALGIGDIQAAAALSARLGEAAPGMAAPLVLQTDIYLRQQLWADAARTLAAIAPEDAEQPNILLKWFEYHCFVGDTQRAEALQARLEKAGLASRQANLPILRFLAEQHRWAEIVDRAIAWLGTDFRYDQIGHVLFRAAKHTGRQAALAQAIAAIDGWQSAPDLVRLHTALAWDGAGTLAEMERVAADAHGQSSRVATHRMAVQRQLLARATAPEGRRALFLCTDAPYLCATIVALHSALLHSAPGREDCFLVVDDALAAQAGSLVQPFRDQGFTITVVPASDVVADATGLDPAYGLFTSGHTLASAAYYRIYFARHLRRLGLYRRAIYIDSDVLVRASLDVLFATDLAGHPLAARVETPRPEVTRAIALHGLADDLYFNSGVLLFDLASDRLDDALDASVTAVTDDSVTLLFHDQCALNLGFRDRFLRLGTAWNTPVTESTRLADLSAETAVLHYLDRPKPWSAAYDGECGMLWFDAWARAAEVIGAEAAVGLFGFNRE